MSCAACSDVQMLQHLQVDVSMKYVSLKPSQWHVAFRPRTQHGRNMNCQAMAVEEAEVKETCESKFRRWKTDETEVLITAKKQHDVRVLESMEKAGIPLTKLRNDWKEIQTICNHRGVQRSADQCRSRWNRLMLTYIQINCWERNIASERLSYWSMMPDEKKATGVLLSNLNQSIYNLLDGLYSRRADSAEEALIENSGEVAECESDHNPLAEGMGLSRKEVSEFLSTEVNVHMIHERAGEKASAPLAGKNIDTDVNLPLIKNVESRDVFSISAEAACEKQNMHTTDAAASVEASVEGTHTYKSTQIEVSSLEVGSCNEKQNQQVIESAASVVQTCEGQRTDSHCALTCVEPHNELSTQCTADKDKLKNLSASGNRCCGVQEIISEEMHSVPSLKSQGLNTTIESGGLKSCDVVLMEHGNDGVSPNQGTGSETFSAIQSEQVAGGEASKCTHIEVHSSVVEERRSEHGHSPPEAIFSIMGSKHSATDKDPKSSTLSVKMVDVIQEKAPADRNSLASHEDLLGKNDTWTKAEDSSAIQIQQIADSATKSNSVEALLRQDADAEGRKISSIISSEQVAEVLESSPESHVMFHEEMSADCQLQPSQGVEIDTMEQGSVTVNLSASSAGMLKQVNDTATISQEVRYQEKQVQDNNLTTRAEQHGLSQPVLGMMDGVSSATKEDDGHSIMVKRMPTMAEQETPSAEIRDTCQCKETGYINKIAMNRSQTSETVHVKETGLQPYDARRNNQDIVMYIPAAISNVVRSVSQVLKKLFKG